MPNKRKPGRPRTFERQAAVDLALQAYWENGLHGLSVNELCRLSGVSKPALYREFGGEDGLQVAALNRYVETVVGPSLTHLDPERPFQANMEGLITFMTMPKATPLGCLHVKMRGAKDRLGEEARAQVDALSTRMRETYRALIEAAQKRGEVRGDLAPDVAAAFIDTQVVTTLSLVAQGEDLERVAELARLAFSALMVRQPDKAKA